SLEGLLSNGLTVLLTVWLWLKFLGTPGKLLLNCQVVDAQSFKPLSIKQAVLRYFAYIVSLLPLGLGFFWIAWDKRKQGFHDKIANSVVLYEAELEADDESQKTLATLMAEVR
ncbi:MAG TPA: RDD family protein, partial [Gammaproteobacteria bacterium]|nr:RDD family protein [Gammaproteobacteria bacterium]